jgi:acyl-CoA synthetase (AMP-forming)/AMP-acid ligase II
MTLIARFAVDSFEPRQVTGLEANWFSLRPDAVVTTEELIEYARQHLGANKYPRQIAIVPAIPLTSVGKLDRKTIRKWAAEGTA